MKATLRYSLLVLFLAVYCVCVICAAATNARYTSSNTISGDDSTEINWSVSEVLEVQSVDQYISAIINGYSNIKIGDEVENPLYVIGESLDISTDLILDLNGHELQRSGREPLLNITNGNRLIIMDSKGGGSLYNPIGSVLSIEEGGTLIVMEGNYNIESGVRPTEYHNYGTGYTGGTIDSSTSSTTVTVNYADNTTEIKNMPIIVPTEDSTGITGNIYFSAAYAENNCSISADTYLYLVTSDSASTLADADEADFSYTYTLYKDDSGAYSADSGNGDAVEATVYGYNNVFTIAGDTDMSLNYDVLGRQVSNFAAIKMEGGELTVRGSYFYSYFGLDTTYCISSSGGQLNISGGEFEALDEGVCINCVSEETDAIIITDGTFTSYRGNTIQMETTTGSMTVSNADFIKNATEASNYADSSSEDDNNSAIYITGGTLDISSSTFTITGDYTKGLYSTGGAVNMADSSITYMNGSNCAAIFATGGEINISGTSSITTLNGVATYLSGGDLNLSGALTVACTLSTAYTAVVKDDGGNTTSTIVNDGIYVSGGSLDASECTLTMTFAGLANDTSVTYFVDFKITSYALHVTGTTKSTVNIGAGEITTSIGGGVKVDSTGGADVTLGIDGEDNNSLSITTTGSGTAVTPSAYRYDSSRTITTSNWQYYFYPNGGNAVEVENGNLTINCGTYSAAQGNGIYVHGSSSVVIIYDGVFIGKETTLTTNVGPAISYAVKLVDGNISIYDGYFGYDGTYSSNGVFIMGSSSSSINTGSGTGYNCNAYLYGGYYNYYGSSSGSTVRAISALGYSYLQIGDENGIYSPTISGSTYAIGLEPFDNSNSSEYSYQGAFIMYTGTVSSSKQDGIWIGNMNYTVDIDGGAITGVDHGINFCKEINKDVTISNAAVTSTSYAAVYFAGTVTGNVTVTNSTIKQTLYSYGIQFASEMFSGSYTLTITDSKIYGASGICIYSSTNSGGAIIISGDTLISGKADTSAGVSGGWDGIELNDFSNTITISSDAVIQGDYNAIRVKGTFSGSITVYSYYALICGSGAHSSGGTCRQIQAGTNNGSVTTTDTTGGTIVVNNTTYTG